MGSSGWPLSKLLDIARLVDVREILETYMRIWTGAISQRTSAGTAVGTSGAASACLVAGQTKASWTLRSMVQQSPSSFVSWPSLVSMTSTSKAHHYHQTQWGHQAQVVRVWLPKKC